MNYKYDCISFHPFTGGCNLMCPFCYKSHKETINTKNRTWWIELIKHCKGLTPQIAVGSDGEPFMDIPFINRMSKECKEQGIIMNVTSNGRLLESLTDEQLKEALEGITMVSISFDFYKRKTMSSVYDYVRLVERIKKLTKTQVGCNMLVDNQLFGKKGQGLIYWTEYMFKCVGVDRVFALYMKNNPAPDILKYKKVYYALTEKYPHFYLDDVSKMVISEGKYHRWKESCHYGKRFISVNSEGTINGCSFDPDGIKLEQPEGIKQEFKFKERHSCPYIQR